jgi:prenyl protein peptidase
MGPISPYLSLPAPLALGLTPQSAHLLSLLFTTTYVGSLYLAQTIGLPAYIRSKKVKTTTSDTTRKIEVQPITSGDVDPHQPEVGSRDHPETIKIRMKAVGVATGLSLFGIYWVVKQTGGYIWGQTVSCPTL